MGLKSSIVTVVGKDSPADKVLQRLRSEKVDIKNVIINPEMKTNFAVVILTEDGERTILVYHGLRDYREVKLKKTLEAKWFFLAPLGENADEIIDDLVSVAARQGARIAWNPGAHQIKNGVSHYRNLLRNVEVLFVNKEEAIKLIDYPVRPQEEEVLKKLNQLGAKIVVMTNGKEGAKVFDGKRFYHIGIYDVAKRVDATGAGDSFATGFVSRLVILPIGSEITKEIITEGLKYGVINSAAVVSKMGAQAGLMTRGQMEAAVAEASGLMVDIWE
ncbi:MAG: putative sugar kinase YdjH [bacterium ADurb.Bin400]|nr:MAG: putative sugar kinase YdjH [bacterium ADurb.Bin400]